MIVTREEAQKWKIMIQEAIADGIKSAKVSELTYLELISLDPLIFMKDSKTEIKSQFIVTPKYYVFTEDDLNKKFVFQRNHGGQTFYFLYEPAKNGKNGEPYKWSGKIEKCKLKGTSPSGEVTVTEGTIELAIHERGENK